MTPTLAIVSLWLAWIVSWLAAAAWTGKTEKRLGAKGELTYRFAAIAVAGVLVLGTRFVLPRVHGHAGSQALWSIARDGAWACVALIACGFAFCWWARIHLGKLWSASITKKADHRVVDTGPYRIVRHPIYSGILLAAYATAAASGTVVGLVLALILTVGLWVKGRLEERWLSRELAPGAYESYRRRVPMLIPFRLPSKRSAAATPNNREPRGKAE